ncbi:pentapeptide repeat-containing protein [Streptomyces sp. NBC_00285]|uniref:pentapeptide repeat-containing protein n=1 Tax=Streptomyces sp. NBC_00285 TaxID=2975700 RepID=UPI002E2ABABD|nr:pentapeptide repeat-containing protein [Streptomyces sp. NBC_00285]
MKSSWKIAGVLAILVTLFVGYAVLLWQGPWWLDGGHLRKRDLQPADGAVITGFRTALVALGAGAVAAAGLYYTDRTLRHTRDRDREQVELSRESQVTDRYVEAIKLLGSDRTVERLGGIYSLERIMRDSSKDHLTVVEVLAAFIREHASAPDQASQPDGSYSRPTEYVQAALTVLGRRPQREEPFRIDLRFINLRGADLKAVRLERVRLAGANLEKADLTEAHLEEAWMQETRLEGAWLNRAHLKDANLRAADLRGASLQDTYFEGARLHEADLSTASGCTAEQLQKALLDDDTKLPPGIAGEPIGAE